MTGTVCGHPLQQNSGRTAEQNIHDLHATSFKLPHCAEAHTIGY